MSHINWGLIDDATFNEFRHAKVEAIAEAYVAESMVDHPDYDRMAALYELGQGQFTANQSYEQREALFRIFIDRAIAEAEAA